MCLLLTVCLVVSKLIGLFREQVPEYRHLLHQSLVLQRELQDILSKLRKEKDILDEVSWQVKMERVSEIKVRPVIFVTQIGKYQVLFGLI